MTDTEWTPERRKIREAEHRACEATATRIFVAETAKEYADRLYPLPPPEYTTFAKETTT